MASKHPVPSKAALNALRGVILTTSCSVILLAEERRRRLQLARAAIENARKLHVVQSNRGPIAVAESHTSWDGRFAEVDDHVLSMASLPRPRTSTRRRGRSHLIGSQVEGGYSEGGSGRAQSISRADGRNTARRSAGDQNLLGDRFDVTNLEQLGLPSSKARPYPDLEWKAPREFVRPGMSGRSLPIKQSASDTLATTSRPTEDPLDTDPYELILDDVECQHVDCVESARLYLEKSSQGGGAVRPFYDDAILALERLLLDLETPDTPKTAASERIGLAIEICQRLAVFGPPLPKAARSIRNQGIRLLHLVSTASPGQLTTTLVALLPLSKDPLKFLLPFMKDAQHGVNRGAVQAALAFLSHNARTCSWARGMLICRLLGRHAKVDTNFDQTKRIYRTLQNAGLFGEFDLPRNTEYRIRRLMTILALEQGDELFADTELGLLKKLDAAACQSDIGLQTRIITRMAGMGKWTEVFSSIEALGQISNIQCIEFQRLLTRTTDIFAQGHNAGELEAVLRKVAVAYKLHLKHRWIYAVLDHYASRRQVENVFSWLQFCSGTGLQMDSTCNQRFFARCRKFWSFSDKTIQSMEASLQSGGWVKESAETPTRATVPMASSQLAQQMEFLASNEQWDQVAEVYEASCSVGADSDIGCLRLAVLAYTKGPNPDIERASGLIQSAHEEGHDVSEAMTPLLLARLERGDDPNILITNAIRMGIRIHDSVFNKAAQALSGAGNHRAAADMCEIAARENGKGELLYNQYNFANLVFAYTGSASYRALQSLLSGFTSDMQWWHGSRTCKETIKLAMKTTAMRTVAHTQNSVPHRQALDKLDDALIHVKKCRSTRDDRRTVSEAYVRLAGAPSTKAHQRMHRVTSSKARKPRREQEAIEQSTQTVVAAAASLG